MTNHLSKSEQIVEDIIEKIRSKELLPGNKLPNEYELSDTYHCSRMAVREALKILTAKGLVVTKHGEGSFVNTLNIETIAEILDNLFLLGEATNIEMMQLRKLMETEAARLCAKNRNEEDLQEIIHYMNLREEYAKAIQTPENIQKKYDADRMFHLSIAKGSHNELFVNFINTIQKTMSLHQSHSASEETSRNTSLYHEEITKAIQDKDADRAADMMNAHLTRVKEAIIQNIKTDK
ncbi:MAG: FadR family transcriptional regulator [Solobacterium sp.]|nr:FadR family transcriptional regulator [Solobacterium sp.]